MSRYSWDVESPSRCRAPKAKDCSTIRTMVPRRLFETTPAVEWLLTESRRGSFHLVAIGPLTNVAAAIEEDPAFAGRLLGLTVMGGLLDERTMPISWQRAIQERGATAWPDYNTMCDPVAALTVARCGIPITWVTLDATMRAPLRAAARGLLPRTIHLAQPWAG